MKKKICKILSIIVLLFVVSVGFRFWLASKRLDDYLKNNVNRTPDKEELFEQINEVMNKKEGLTDDEISLVLFELTDRYVIPAVGFPKRMIELPFALNYYKFEDGEAQIAMTQKVGTTIECKFESFDFGRGFQSLPSNIRGYRIIRPFVEKWKEPREEWYYIKAEDLKKLIRYVLDTTDMPYDNAEYGKWLAAEGIFEFTDRRILVKGMFRSSDLKVYEPSLNPVTGFWNVFMKQESEEK